ncbi:MAG: BlaI/MecI/CopY family transcriptional regulator [Deltaproteobacteria bacterium]|jgi:predicted transcriptional regulator|nr:BlaI/MecI/CopY family transcriptional regulator [Deltaproteobacteria bacterium]MBW2532717.1 BlaI/MecI/CopY family transcriptional regulator [Deltaproteobacteria bacterium]
MPTQAVAKSMGDLEEAAMQVLWSSAEPLAVRGVMQRLRRRPALAYTTVLTVLRRLHAKGLLARSKQGKAYVYAPAVSRERWMGLRAARELLGHDRSGPSRAVLMAFLDSAERADPKLVDRLSELISARKRTAGKTGEGEP